MKNISISFIKELNQEYKKDKNNKIIENSIKNTGIDMFCLNSDIVNKTGKIFSIELPKSKIYNQEDSGLCWIYAGINLIKNNVANNLNIDENNFTLSINYLSFLDKLEKSNTIYNRIIENNNFEFEKEIRKEYLKHAVYEGGYFENFRSLVKKYGIVPEEAMPDVKNSKNSKCLVKIYNEKIKKDIYKLLSLKKNKKSNNELYKIKQKMLEENHKILSKCLGKLPLVFNYEYMDKNNKYSKLKDITPLEFLNKYLTIELDDLIGIANVPMYNKDYYKLYRKQFSENIYEKDYVDFINMPIEVLKELSIKHLKDGIPVYFGCNMTKMKNADIGIMDSNLYNYKDVFDIDILTKEEALSMYDISFEHVMLITGVHIEDNKIIRWKVEDSYGETTHQDGYYIMNDNFFDDYVIEVIIDKKYLSKEQLELLKQEVTYIDMNDPF